MPTTRSSLRPWLSRDVMARLPLMPNANCLRKNTGIKHVSPAHRSVYYTFEKSNDFCRGLSSPPYTVHETCHARLSTSPVSYHSFSYTFVWHLFRCTKSLLYWFDELLKLRSMIDRIRLKLGIGSVSRLRVITVTLRLFLFINQNRYPALREQERAIASMGPEALGPKSKGQFCVVVSALGRYPPPPPES